jgi:hypothetical protein
LGHDDTGLAAQAQRGRQSSRGEPRTIVRRDLEAQVLSHLSFAREPLIDSSLADIKVKADLGHRNLPGDTQAPQGDPETFGVSLRIQPDDLG